MLQNDLYTVKSLTRDESRVAAVIGLNAMHPVFEGHFPGNPVLPGVCIIQITKELLESVTGKKLIMKTASNIKYIAFISPMHNNTVQFDLTLAVQSGRIIACSCNVTSGETVFCRMKSEFEIQL